MDGAAMKRSWAWMEEHMPTVVQQLKRKRAEGLGPHINECWRRGVLQLEPGWFYAGEGAVSIGVPAGHLLADPALVQLRKDFPGQALLMLKEVSDGKA
jgi:hypothetical protein